MRGVRSAAILLSTIFFLGLGFNGCAKSRVVLLDSPPPTALAKTATAATVAAIVPGRQPSTSTSSGAGPALSDACVLLLDKEIRRVQGERLQEAKGSGRLEGGLRVAQCFFTLPTFTNSISLTVTHRGTGSEARDPRAFWEEKFGGAEDEADKDHNREKRTAEEEEESAPPLRVARVGEEAFWTGSAVGGALYVLKGNAFVRVSIGGSGDQRTKINKSKALARFVLKHL